METTCLTTVSYAVSTLIKGRRHIQIELPENYRLYGREDIKDLNRKQRKPNGDLGNVVKKRLIEFREGNSRLASKRYPLRFSSGGALFLLEDSSGNIDGEYILTVCRTDQPRLSALAGYSQNQEEIEDPRKVITREATEEATIIIGDTMLEPTFYRYVKDIKNIIIDTGGYQHFRNVSYFLLNDYELNLDYVSVRIKGPNNRVSFLTNASWDPTKAALDFINIGRLRIPLLETLIKDTEQDKGVDLKRNYVLIPIKGLREGLEDMECLVMNGWDIQGIKYREPLSSFKIGTTVTNILERVFKYKRRN